MPGSDDLRAQLQDIIAELQANKPKADDYRNADGSVDQLTYQTILQNWSADYRDWIKVLQGYSNEEMGVAELPDGTLVPLDELSPEEQDYVSKYNDQLYNQLMTKYGLEAYSQRRQGVLDENQRMLDEYNAKSDELRNKMAVDESNLGRALANLERWMSGQQVAGDEADRIQTAQQEATKYGTSNGKRSFSGADLGAGVSMLAQQGGIPLNASLISYPGVQTWDPAGDRANALAGMGISGEAPLIPASAISMGDVPAPPQFGSTGSAGAPSIPMPAMPSSPPNLPDWKPNLGGAAGAVGSAAGSAATAAQPAAGLAATSDFVRRLINGRADPMSLGIR